MQNGFRKSRYEGDPFAAAKQDAVNPHTKDTESPDAIELPHHGHPHTIEYPAHPHDNRTGA